MTEFLARGECQNWTKGMIVAVDIADVVLLLAYIGLPALAFLFYLIVQKRNIDIPKHLVLWCGAFVLACGLTHGMDVLMTWFPAWHVDIAMHMIAAGLSLAAFVSALVAMRSGIAK
jgi:hypothetical protein